MINFKALTLAATLAAGSIFGGVAQAAPTKCAIINDRIDLFEVIDCDMSHRVNANGHTVMDVALFGSNGTERVSFIWWINRDGSHKYAEVFLNGKREAARSFEAKNGAWCAELPSSNGDVTICVD